VTSPPSPRDDNSIAGKFLNTSVSSYHGELPPIPRHAKAWSPHQGLAVITDARLVLGLAAWYDVMYNASILHRLAAADASVEADAVAAVLHSSPQFHRSLSNAIDVMEAKANGRLDGVLQYNFGYNLCKRDREILSAGKHVLALRARLNRPQLSVWHGIAKAMQRHAARIFNDLTALALIVAAFCHLDVWAVILLLLSVFALFVSGDDRAAALLFKPAKKRSMKRSHLTRSNPREVSESEAASPAQAFAREAVEMHLQANSGFVRSWLWPAMTVLLAVMIGIRYIATVGWPPFLFHVRNKVWPWSDDESMQYYFGVGETVTGLQLLPDFVALLLASLTKR